MNSAARTQRNLKVDLKVAALRRCRPVWWSDNTKVGADIT